MSISLPHGLDEHGQPDGPDVFAGELQRVVAHPGTRLDPRRRWRHCRHAVRSTGAPPKTNRVPTSVPNLFLVTNAVTHCAYSLVPTVPSVPMSQKSIAPPPGYIANSKHTEHQEHDETQGD
jgi:hypothetical protein